MDMDIKIKVIIDGKEVYGKQGQSIVECARENKVYVPTLCDFKSLKPAGTCRVCTVKVGGRPMAGCTTEITDGMVVENESKDVSEIRRALIEMLFVEGNHMCPTCERSGSCELQAMAYRYKMMAPRFPFLFPNRDIEASYPHMMLEHNRCIQCLRCVRGVRSKEDEPIFGFTQRGHKIKISVDPKHMKKFTVEMAQKAMDICPVGAILKKGKGFDVPIGNRKFDKTPIGNDIEKA